jgi:hypothetical protein
MGLFSGLDYWSMRGIAGGLAHLFFAEYNRNSHLVV